MAIFGHRVSGLAFAIALSFTQNLLACAAGLATLQALLDDGLLEASVALGEEFQTGLQAIQRRFPRHIPYVLGKGMVAALHFADPVGEVPDLLCSRICEEALRCGLLLVHTGRESIKLAPPLCIPPAALHEGVAVLADAIATVLVQP